MGTSQSSGGPSGGVPMVPPWTPDPPAEGAEIPNPNDSADGESDGVDAASLPPEPTASGPLPPIPLAPRARFGGTRRSLGDFARTGNPADLRRGVGRYVRSGYGGASTASRRFGGTAATAGTLGGALARLAAGAPAAPGSALDPALLAGRSAQEVMAAIVEAVRPVDGTQDAEVARASIRDAMTELLTRFPDADLLNLEPDQRAFAIERYVAGDVFRRLELDVGKTIMEKAPNATTALSRLRQVRDYVRETVAAAFRRLRTAGRVLTAVRVDKVVRDALRETFQVFEGYAE